MGLDLTALKIRESFPLLLQCGNDQAEGLDATLRAIADGKGQDSAFDLSTAAIRARSPLRLAQVNAPGSISGESQLYHNADGQLHVRTPSADYALTPPGGGTPAGVAWHLGRATGRYYHQLAGSVVGTFSVTMNRLYAQPFIISHNTTMTKLGIEVTTAAAAGKLLRLGLYSNNGSVPDALILDAGTLPADGIAVLESAISQALTPGLYWMALVTDGGTLQVRGITNERYLETFFGGSSSTGGGSANMVYANFTFAALPATFPALIYDWNSNGPGIWTRS